MPPVNTMAPRIATWLIWHLSQNKLWSHAQTLASARKRFCHCTGFHSKVPIYIYPKKIETFFEDVTTTKRQGCFFPRFLKAGRTIWEKFREKKHTNMEFPRMYAESIDRSGILKYSLQKCVERSYLDHFYASKLFHLWYCLWNYRERYAKDAKDKFANLEHVSCVFWGKSLLYPEFTNIQWSYISICGHT